MPELPAEHANAGVLERIVGRAPEPDDISVCAYCGHVQVYGADLKFRELTDAEIVECAGDPELLAAQEFVRRFREWRA